MTNPISSSFPLASSSLSRELAPPVSPTLPDANLPSATAPATSLLDTNSLSSTSAGETDELQERFQQFVGETLFGSMLASMRKTVEKPAYMHGGRGEEVFQQQLDQTLVQEITKASADKIADPMFELFQMSRS